MVPEKNGRDGVELWRGYRVKSSGTEGRCEKRLLLCDTSMPNDEYHTAHTAIIWAHAYCLARSWGTHTKIKYEHQHKIQTGSSKVQTQSGAKAHMRDFELSECVCVASDAAVRFLARGWSTTQELHHISSWGAKSPPPSAATLCTGRTFIIGATVEPAMRRQRWWQWQKKRRDEEKNTNDIVHIVSAEWGGKWKRVMVSMRLDIFLLIVQYKIYCISANVAARGVRQNKYIIYSTIEWSVLTEAWRGDVVSIFIVWMLRAAAARTWQENWANWRNEVYDLVCRWSNSLRMECQIVNAARVVLFFRSIFIYAVYWSTLTCLFDSDRGRVRTS